MANVRTKHSDILAENGQALKDIIFGGLNNVLVVDTSCALTANDSVVLATAITADVTVTLPSISSVKVGTTFFFKNIDASHDLIVDPYGTEDIYYGSTSSTDGTALTLDQDEALVLVSDGTQWIILLKDGTIAGLS